ncbi:hypothetical protein B0H10DRAFT_2314851 [Mycena sp. CBHHK59/15]|nr:hypothetical protein B0H10DRAFT_2314851 [Mycena sp. CBHHK59/15]
MASVSGQRIQPKRVFDPRSHEPTRYARAFSPATRHWYRTHSTKQSPHTMAPGYKKARAANARTSKGALKITPVTGSSDPDSSESDNCHWDGTEGDKVPQFFDPFFNPWATDGSATEWNCEDGSLPTDDCSSESDKDLVGHELLKSLARAGAKDDASIAAVYEDWTAAEKKLRGRYTGNSGRSQRRNDKKLRDKDEDDEVSRKSTSASLFKTMFPVLPRTIISNTDVAPAPGVVDTTTTTTTPLHTPTIIPSPTAQSSPPVAVPDDIFTGYISDISSGDFSEIGGDKTSGFENADGRTAQRTMQLLGRNQYLTRSDQCQRSSAKSLQFLKLNGGVLPPFKLPLLVQISSHLP